VAPGEALRRLGRTAFDSFYATTVGRRLMSLVARDTQQLLLRGPMAYRFSGNFGKFSTELVGERHVRATVREYPEFLEHYHSGVIEGALLHTGSRAIIRIDVLALDAADFEIRWEPLALQRDDQDLAAAKKRTSAGVTAALDIALRMIEEDDGQPLAFEVAQWLVMYLRRAGGQTPVKASLARQSAEHEPIAETLAWASEHLAENLSVDALAHHAHMSTRNFARLFVTEMGTSPAAYVEQLRIEEAQRLLATTRRSLKEIAQATGFRSATVLSRAFYRLLGMTPDAYRRRG
jgi:AraC-like DNA-binding protein